MDTGKWKLFIITSQLNNSSSKEAGYDSKCPAPSPFRFHAFPPLKPWWLSLLSGGDVLQILRTIESWSWNAFAVSQ